MTAYPANPRILSRCRGGFTLLEIVLSVVIISMLMASMMSAILLSSRAIDDGTSTAAKTIQGRQALDEITTDLRLALSVTESTATAVTFTVPDRTGDSITETIRYAWSGTAGDPVTQTFNGTTIEFVQDVHGLDFNYLMRTLQAENDAFSLLFVVPDPSALDVNDLARKTLMEAWGYSVTLIDDNASQSTFDDAIAAATVAYISTEIDDPLAGTKLASTNIGIVYEPSSLVQEFGFSSGEVTGKSRDTVRVDDNSHYITLPFATGDVTIFSSTQLVNMIGSGASSELTVLGQTLDKGKGYAPSLALLDVGDALYNSGTTPGRRAKVPWGDAGFAISALNDDGQTIMKRAIDWAAGNEQFYFGHRSVGVTFQDSVTSRIRCTQATLSMDATITDIVAYIRGPIGEQVRFGIYTDSGGEPGTKIVETALDPLTVSTAHWHTISITPTDLTAGTYWLAIGFSSTSMYYYHASGGQTRHKHSDTPALPTAWGDSGYYPSWTISIYGVGTPN